MAVVLSDTELARTAQGGDAVSLGILLERHQGALHAQALDMLGQGSQVHNALQDVYLVALSTIELLRELPPRVRGCTVSCVMFA